MHGETGIITEQLIKSLSNNSKASDKKTKPFTVEELFVIKKTPSYNKDILTEVVGKEYDYITRTSTNRGVCETTGYIIEQSRYIQPWIITNDILLLRA